MDTHELEAQMMVSAGDAARLKNHEFGLWESFLGGAVRILECAACHRFVLTSVLPNGDDENGNQVYETEIRGSASTVECGARRVC
jgi:hypothetical protein